MTPRQKECRDFVAERIAATGCSPSFQEVGEHLGIVSKASVHRLIAGLLAQGKLVRTPGSTRRNLALPGVDLSAVDTPVLVAELERRGWHRG